MSMIISGIAGTLSGIIGAMGMGGGGVLIIYLTLFTDIEQTRAQGINLIFFIPSAIIALIFYIKKRLIEWRIIIPSAICGLLGALLGTYFTGIINSYILGKIFAGMLLIMGVKQLFYKKVKDT